MGTPTRSRRSTPGPEEARPTPTPVTDGEIHSMAVGELVTGLAAVEVELRARTHDRRRRGSAEPTAERAVRLTVLRRQRDLLQAELTERGASWSSPDDLPRSPSAAWPPPPWR
jgi:hypothetical protein